jgi:hypothetical protein
MGNQSINFTVGSPKHPNIQHDNGFLDTYPRRAPTTEDRFRYMQWGEKLKLGKVVNFFGFRDLPDALPAYQHFYEGTGTDRTFDYRRFIDNDESGRVVYAFSRLVTRQAIEQIYKSSYEAGAKTARFAGFSITGSAIAVGGKDDRFPYPKTENWQKTIGAHFIWISANVQVFPATDDGIPFFKVLVTIHAEDRYNFNPGNKDIATGIPDDDNGIFEITGLAKQYMNYSTYSWWESWNGSTPDLGYVIMNLPGPWA